MGISSRGPGMSDRISIQRHYLNIASGTTDSSPCHIWTPWLLASQEENRTKQNNKKLWVLKKGRGNIKKRMPLTVHGTRAREQEGWVEMRPWTHRSSLPVLGAPSVAEGPQGRLERADAGITHPLLEGSRLGGEMQRPF